MKVESVGPILQALAPWLGKPLNYTILGRQMGVSYHSAKARVLALAESNLLWLLYPIPTGSGSGVRKAPKPYLLRPELIRLAGRLSAASLGAAAPAAPSAPAQPGTAAPLGPSAPGQPDAAEQLQLRSRLIGIIRQRESEAHPSSSFWYYGGYGANHIELIVEREGVKIGFVFLLDKMPSRWGWSYCRRILAAGIIRGGFILYPGRRAFFACRCLAALPAGEFLNHYQQWMEACLEGSQEKLQTRVRAYNSAQSRRIRIDRQGGAG